MGKNTDESGLYALVPEERELVSRTPARPKPVVIEYRRAATEAPNDTRAPGDKAIDLHLPLALLGGGVVVEVVAAMVAGAGVVGVQRQLAEIAAALVVAPAIMMAGMLIAARFRGIELGHLGTAVMKLAAISIAPGAAATLLAPIAGIIPIAGWLVLLLVQFALYFALIGTMFKLDESDTWYCVCVIFVLNVAVYFGMRAVGVGVNA